MDTSQSSQHIVSHNSIKLFRQAVYFESEWLSKEQNPVCRANGARRLAELAAKLADMEEAEVGKYREQVLDEAV
jgi:hypothetical protein